MPRLYHDRREIQQAYRYDSPLGYVYCHDCTPESERPKLEFVYPPGPGDEAVYCERCKRALHAVTVTTWANVILEGFECKIF